ncbi:MAG: hypothetical protein JWN65_635, partial [Solirubrobacterales bacterium]|nr:hypothetical protein [Solirubrobacterales bacterium]
PAPAAAAPAGAEGDPPPAGPSIQVPGLPPIQLPPLPGALGASGKSGDSTVADLLHYLLGS